MLVTRGHLSGFGMHLNDMYYRYEPNVSINFTPVAIAVILIGLTGAITDTALDIATSLHEVHENNKHLSFKELIHSGNHMGQRYTWYDDKHFILCISWRNHGIYTRIPA